MMTKEEAIAFHDSGAWKTLSNRDRAILQLREDRLFMPLEVFHESLEAALGYGVFLHEIALYREHLLAQLMAMD